MTVCVELSKFPTQTRIHLVNHTSGGSTMRRVSRKQVIWSGVLTLLMWLILTQIIAPLLEAFHDTIVEWVETTFLPMLTQLLIYDPWGVLLFGSGAAVTDFRKLNQPDWVVFWFVVFCISFILALRSWIQLVQPPQWPLSGIARLHIPCWVLLAFIAGGITFVLCGSLIFPLLLRRRVAEDTDS